MTQLPGGVDIEFAAGNLIDRLPNCRVELILNSPPAIS